MAALPKTPTRKSRCQACSAYIYVKSRPSDRAKVLVSEQDAAGIEQQWNDYHAINAMSAEDRHDYDRTRDTLRSSWGTDPFHNDVRWSMCNCKSEQSLRTGDQGTYRNLRYQMAEILREDGKSTDALATFLEVFFFDNKDPRDAFVAPALIGEIAELIDELHLPEAALRALYERVIRERVPAFRPASAVGPVWQRLHEELVSWEKDVDPETTDQPATSEDG